MAQQNTRPDESNHKSRNWICTLNNYTEVEYARILSWSDAKCQYAVIAKEVGKTGIPHLQIYFQMKTAYAGQSIKNATTKRMWMGIAKNPEKAREYCMKEEDYVEVGEFKSGKLARQQSSAKGGDATKSLWTALNNQINAGASELEIKDNFPSVYFKHHGGISKGIAIANKIPRRTEKTCVHVLLGPPGVGKTTRALELVGDDGYWYSSPNKIWWTGYTGQPGVVFDDFHGNYPFEEFKKLLDKYPLQVPVHNGMTNFNSKLVVITSNMTPDEWYRQEVFGTHGKSALFRRIHVIESWDHEEKKFIFLTQKDNDIQNHPLWTDGCVCQTRQSAEEPPLDKTVDIPRPLEPIPKPKLDLSNSEFVKVTSGPLKLKKPTTLSTKIQKRNLTAELDDLYPEPVKQKKIESPPPKRQKISRGKAIDIDLADVYDFDSDGIPFVPGTPEHSFDYGSSDDEENESSDSEPMSESLE
jgi:hypothetical protein